MSKKIAVIGLGYVGLPLAVAFGKKLCTLGFDINAKRIEELKGGYDRTAEVNRKELSESKSLYFTSMDHDLQPANYYIITVPTPVDSGNKPDLTPIRRATELVARYLTKGDIVIYESTVYPGVTEEICVPLLEKISGLIFNRDFFCGYSPERINPGDSEHSVTSIIKVTSGSTPEAAEKVDNLYKEIITAGTYKAPCIKVAEAAKVIENTQRDVIIALMNELSRIFDTMNLNTREVIEAASTKWNFIKLFPGLVGGHCIGVDPYYLTYKSIENNYEPNLILTARRINNGMAKFVVENTIKYMIHADKRIKGSNVLLMGLTFKENCPDTRNSKVKDIIQELKGFGCNVDIVDPWVGEFRDMEWPPFNLVEFPFDKEDYYDAIIITVGHSQFEGMSKHQIESASRGKPVVMDLKGIYGDASWYL